MDEAAAHAQLGSATIRDQADLRQANRPLGVALLVLGVIAAVVGVGIVVSDQSAKGGGWGSFGMLVFGLAVAALGAGTLRRRGPRQFVAVYERGIVYAASSGQPVVLRWDGVEYVQTRAYAINRTRHFMVTVSDGVAAITVAERFPRQSQIADAVTSAVCSVLLPRMTARIEGGGSVEFGPLSVSRRSVRYEQRSLAWRDVAGFQARGGDLLVLARGTSTPWAKVPAMGLPNLAVFLELAEQRCADARADDGPQPN
jgi:hypothetical protein